MQPTWRLQFICSKVSSRLNNGNFSFRLAFNFLPFSVLDLCPPHWPFARTLIKTSFNSFYVFFSWQKYALKIFLYIAVYYNLKPTKIISANFKNWELKFFAEYCFKRLSSLFRFFLNPSISFFQSMIILFPSSVSFLLWKSPDSNVLEYARFFLKQIYCTGRNGICNPFYVHRLQCICPLVVFSLFDKYAFFWWQAFSKKFCICCSPR